MFEVEDPSKKRVSALRKLVGGRHLLIATIGAATVNYAGCGEDTMSLVANLMAAPYLPPQDGAAGATAPPDVSNPSGLAGAGAFRRPEATDTQDGGVEGDLGSRR